MNTAYVYVTVFLALWETMMTAPENCLKVEVDGNVSRNKLITVEDNAYTNVSFLVKLDDCHNSPQHWFLKMSRTENNMVLDECKLVFINKTCQYKGEHPCSCSGTDWQTINFRKFFSKSEYNIYHWSASPFSAGLSETLMEIVFAIRKPAEVRDNHVSANETKCVCLCNCLHAVTVSYVCVAIVIAIILECIVRRHWKTNGLSSSWSCVGEPQVTRLASTPSESIAHGQVVQSTAQLEIQVNDLYDHLNRR